MKKTCFLSLFFLLFSVVESLKASVPANHLAAFDGSEYDNGYPEERFDQVLATLIETFTPEIQKRGGTLHIKRDWQDGAVNAFAWRDWAEYHLEILGGAARYYLVSEDAFIMLVCHEMGHLLGGKPGSSQIALEGQADYFASSKCTRKMYAKIPYWDNVNVPAPSVSDLALAREKCAISAYDKAICERSILAGWSLGRLWGKIAGDRSLPGLGTGDSSKVPRTLDRHPGPQCRLDTYVAGALCAVSAEVNFSFQDEKVGACGEWSDPVGMRPACWFAAGTFLF